MPCVSKATIQKVQNMVNLTLKKQKIIAYGGSQKIFREDLKVLCLQLVEIKQLSHLYFHIISLEQCQLQTLVSQESDSLLQQLLQQIELFDNFSSLNYNLQEELLRSINLFNSTLVTVKEKSNLSEFLPFSYNDMLVFEATGVPESEGSGGAQQQHQIANFLESHFSALPGRCIVQNRQMAYLRDLRHFAPAVLSSCTLFRLRTLSARGVFEQWLGKTLLSGNRFFKFCTRTLKICFTFFLESTVHALRTEQANLSDEQITRNFLSHLEIFLNEFRKTKIARGEYQVPEIKSVGGTQQMRAAALYAAIASYKSKKEEQLQQQEDET